MLGEMYRLVQATMGVLRNEGRQTCQILPEGSIVQVEDGLDNNKVINVECAGRRLWMFSCDLAKRGTPIHSQPIPPDELTTSHLDSSSPRMAETYLISN